MKKQLLTKVVVVIVCVLGGVVFLMRGLNHMKWLDYTPSEIRDLALSVESFRDETGAYPKELSQLADENGPPSSRRIAHLLKGVSGNQYHYYSTSNGFVISAIKSPSIFSRSEFVESRFQTGNLFNDKK